MPKVKRILFPVDLSDTSPKIVPWVIETAEAHRAEICLLFVARAFEYYSPLNVPRLDEFQRSIKEQGLKSLTEFTERYFKDKGYTAEVIVGHPAEVILEYAVEKEIDLIVMGTHGRRGLDRILFGSVADHVVKQSPVPVLTVNPHRNREAADD